MLPMPTAFEVALCAMLANAYGARSTPITMAQGFLVWEQSHYGPPRTRKDRRESLWSELTFVSYTPQRELISQARAIGRHIIGRVEIEATQSHYVTLREEALDKSYLGEVH